MITIADIARIAHEANKFFCHAIGDDSQPHFHAAPDWQQTSAIKGVEFHAANPDATPERSHESWLANKLAEGWQYGPTKNPDLKLHPCVKPYDELPPEQQAKDHLFRAVVHALLPFAMQVPVLNDVVVAVQQDVTPTPFEGQFAYFRPSNEPDHYVAKITKVWSDTCVNLEYHKDGAVINASSVLVWPAGKEEGRPNGYYCELTTNKFDDVYPPKIVEDGVGYSAGNGAAVELSKTELGAPFTASPVDSGGTGAPMSSDDGSTNLPDNSKSDATSEPAAEQQPSSGSGSTSTDSSTSSESTIGAGSDA